MSRLVMTWRVAKIETAIGYHTHHIRFGSADFQPAQMEVHI